MKKSQIIEELRAWKITAARKREAAEWRGLESTRVYWDGFYDGILAALVRLQD